MELEPSDIKQYFWLLFSNSCPGSHLKKESTQDKGRWSRNEHDLCIKAEDDSEFWFPKSWTNSVIPICHVYMQIFFCNSLPIHL